MSTTAGEIRVREPRWPAALAVLAIGALHSSLPESLTLGPSWLLGLVALALVAPTLLAHWCGNHVLNQVLGHLLAAVVTAFTVWSVGMLVASLPEHKLAPEVLLKAAAALWVSNILVFASWYWRLDAGGPYAREARPGHITAAFVFPQMTLDPTAAPDAPHPTWSPGFVDYLFLAFNTSTALSPTDTPVLSRWAKVLSMIQATISLTIVVILAARAVNIM